MDFRLLLVVGLGGAVGSVGRFAVSYLIQSRATSAFPYGTLLVNVTGALLLGFVMRYATESTAVSVETRVLLTTGFCGGYTTFSTFSYETARLMQDGDYRRAVSYMVASVVMSLAAIFAGLALAGTALNARRAL